MNCLVNIVKTKHIRGKNCGNQADNTKERERRAKKKKKRRWGLGNL